MGLAMEMEWRQAMELTGVQLCYALLKAEGRRNIDVEIDGFGLLRCTFDAPEIRGRSARFIGDALDGEELKSMRYEVANKLGRAVQVPKLKAPNDPAGDSNEQAK